jgi:hypothetical protein
MGRTKNRAWYLGNRVRFARSFLVGLDYLRWKTTFRTLRSGTDNRVHLYLQYDF